MKSKGTKTIQRKVKERKQYKGRNQTSSLNIKRVRPFSKFSVVPKKIFICERAVSFSYAANIVYLFFSSFPIKIISVKVLILYNLWLETWTKKTRKEKKEKQTWWLLHPPSGCTVGNMASIVLMPLCRFPLRISFLLFPWAQLSFKMDYQYLVWFCA